jgi:hypothetical protein
MEASSKNIIKVRVHDGIVGILNISSILLASQFGLDWIYVAVVVAILQIASPFTKFCPVYINAKYRANSKWKIKF